MPQGYAQTFASIEGTLVISATSKDDLPKIIEDLINRPELELTSSVIYGSDAVSLNLKYSAHGAWPADFRHKVGSSANRLGISGEVEVSIPAFARVEGPSTCPRLLSGKACYACQRGKELEAEGLPVPSQFRLPLPMERPGDPPLMHGTYVPSSGRRLANDQWLVTFTKVETDESFTFVSVNPS